MKRNDRYIFASVILAAILGLVIMAAVSIASALAAEVGVWV